MNKKKFFSLFLLLATISILGMGWCKRQEMREWFSRKTPTEKQESSGNHDQLDRIEQLVDNIDQKLENEKDVSYETELSGLPGVKVVTTRRGKATSQPTAESQSTTPLAATTQPVVPTTQPAQADSGPPATSVADEDEALPWYKHPLVVLPSLLAAVFIFRVIYRWYRGNTTVTTTTTTPVPGGKKETVTKRSSTDWGKAVWRLALLGVAVWLCQNYGASAWDWFNRPKPSPAPAREPWPRNREPGRGQVDVDSTRFGKIEVENCQDCQVSIFPSGPVKIIAPSGKEGYDGGPGTLNNMGEREQSLGTWQFKSAVPGQSVHVDMTWKPRK